MNHPILWDCHMHSSFSADSDTPAEQMVQQAIALGLHGICMTEHLDPDFPDTPEQLEFSLDFPSYYLEWKELKNRYKEHLDLRYGVEFGLQPHLGDVLRQTVLENPLDFVIGSVHLLEGMDPYYKEVFTLHEEAACYRLYFESILANLTACTEFDVLGHLDYILRYGPTQNRFFQYHDYQNLLDEILKTLIKKQIGLELNTGGYRAGLGVPNPAPVILRRYRELGGEILTVGADAHTPDRIADSFDLAADLLRDCGYRYYCVFKERKAEFLPL